MTVMPQTQWKHPSVVALSADADPVKAITQKARNLVFQAIEAGWKGPPFDPVELAELRGIQIEARADVSEARLIPRPNGKFTIQFNPDRPRNRIRYSIAHEIAHTLFPDAARRIRQRISYRNRTGRHEPGHWQLEVLCDLAAAEILMPIGEGGELQKTPVEIDSLIGHQREYQVSMEAVLLRVMRLTARSCAAFAAARIEQPQQSRPIFRVDYCIGAEAWRRRPRLRGRLIRSPVLSQCTAIGYTAKGNERWWSGGPQLRVEGVGVPPFAGSIYPRIIGLLLDDGQEAKASDIEWLIGDATSPQVDGKAVIAHIVNDKTPNWGRGFGLALAKRWPQAREEFRRWTLSDKNNLRLGRTHATKLTDKLYAFQMVAQRGYKPGPRPLIRYQHLDSCLGHLATFAAGRSASVHMPLIGTGYAGGRWSVIEEIIRERLTKLGVPVTVYGLPGQVRPPDAALREPSQLTLDLAR